VCDSRFRHELLPYADGVEHVGLADMRSLESNPARIIPAWSAFVEQATADGGRPLGIGEPVWPERTFAELTECERHESLLDVAFDDGPAWRLVCPYDLDRLEDKVIEAAYRTHSLLAHDGESNGFRHEHNNPAGPFEGFLPSPVAGFEELAFGREEPGDTPHAAHRRARAGDQRAGHQQHSLRRWRRAPASMEGGGHTDVRDPRWRTHRRASCRTPAPETGGAEWTWAVARQPAVRSGADPLFRPRGQHDTRAHAPELRLPDGPRRFLLRYS
jgi:hypothetical protein